MQATDKLPDRPISIVVESQEYLEFAAGKLLDYAGTERIFLFEGEMGSGKTTFIKAICKKLMVKDNAASPSYSIINEYLTISGEKIYHFDLFRIKSTDELAALGYEEYLGSGSFCFIEWPEKMGELMPETCIRVAIDVMDEYRTFTFSRHH